MSRLDQKVPEGDLPMPAPQTGHHGRRPVAAIGPQNVGGVSQNFFIRWTAFRRHQAAELVSF